ncbi:MAG: hypothetical protein ACRDGN_13115 [bacterium]
MEDNLQALLASAGFLPDGLTMKLRHRGIEIDAVDHPLYGISLWGMRNTGRTLANCDIFVPFDSTSDQIVDAVNKLCDRLGAPADGVPQQRRA